jgi:hypothetical protein
MCRDGSNQVWDGVRSDFTMASGCYEGCTVWCITYVMTYVMRELPKHGGGTGGLLFIHFLVVWSPLDPLHPARPLD